MYQPLIKFHPYPAIITQVLPIFAYRYLEYAIEDIIIKEYHDLLQRNTERGYQPPGRYI